VHESTPPRPHLSGSAAADMHRGEEVQLNGPPGPSSSPSRRQGSAPPALFTSIGATEGLVHAAMIDVGPSGGHVGSERHAPSSSRLHRVRREIACSASAPRAASTSHPRAAAPWVAARRARPVTIATRPLSPRSIGPHRSGTDNLTPASALGRLSWVNESKGRIDRYHWESEPWWSRPQASDGCSNVLLWCSTTSGMRSSAASARHRHADRRRARGDGIALRQLPRRPRSPAGRRCSGAKPPSGRHGESSTSDGFRATTRIPRVCDVARHADPHGMRRTRSANGT
jgi:hypothetical protein